MRIPDDADISCTHQIKTPEGIICGLLDVQHSDAPYVRAEHCYRCEVGRISRELGCSLVGGEFSMIPSGDGTVPGYVPTRILCQVTDRDTTYDQCKSCTLREGADPVHTTGRTLDLLEAKGMTAARKHLLGALTRFFRGDNDGAVTLAVTAAESALKHILDVSGKPYPSQRALPGLWKACSPLITVKSPSDRYVKRLLGSPSGAITALMRIRNTISDTHGDINGTIGPDPALAGSAINNCCAICMFVARRFPFPDE